MTIEYTIYNTECNCCGKSFKSIEEGGMCNDCIIEEFKNGRRPIRVPIYKSPETKAYNKIKSDKNNLKLKIKVMCNCGNIVSTGNLVSHKKTKIHKIKYELFCVELQNKSNTIKLKIVEK